MNESVQPPPVEVKPIQPQIQPSQAQPQQLQPSQQLPQSQQPSSIYSNSTNVSSEPYFLRFHFILENLFRQSILPLQTILGILFLILLPAHIPLSFAMESLIFLFLLCTSSLFSHLIICPRLTVPSNPLTLCNPNPLPSMERRRK